MQGACNTCVAQLVAESKPCLIWLDHKSLNAFIVVRAGERARNVCVAQQVAEGNPRLIWLAHNDFQEVSASSAAVHGGLIPAEAGPNLDSDAVTRMPGFLVCAVLWYSPIG